VDKSIGAAGRVVAMPESGSDNPVGSGPNPVDIEVGRRIRMRRLLTGLSQSDVARALGISFQQVQKYERGINRISASRLARLAAALEVPVSYFFTPTAEVDTQADLGLRALLDRPETLNLVKLYYQVPRPARRQLLGIMRALTRQNPSEEP
jgi:transcriptional regulator with XRE-family HTH domain